MKKYVLGLCLVLTSVVCSAGVIIKDDRYVAKPNKIDLMQPQIGSYHFKASDGKRVQVDIIKAKDNRVYEDVLKFKVAFLDEEIGRWETATRHPEQYNIFFSYYFRNSTSLFDNAFSASAHGPDELAMLNVFQLRTQKLHNGKPLIDFIMQDSRETEDDPIIGDKAVWDNVALTFTEDGKIREVTYLDTTRTNLNGFWEGQVFHKGKVRIVSRKVYRLLKLN